MIALEKLLTDCKESHLSTRIFGSGPGDSHEGATTRGSSKEWPEASGNWQRDCFPAITYGGETIREVGESPRCVDSGICHAVWYSGEGKEEVPGPCHL